MQWRTNGVKRDCGYFLEIKIFELKSIENLEGTKNVTNNTELIVNTVTVKAAVLKHKNIN